MEAVILQLIKAENPELCRSIMRNFLTQSRFKITSPYAQLIYARGTSYNFSNIPIQRPGN